ncbi:beta-propeller fold lactonase family protein [Paenibacillus sp. RUD330]|uniref:DUF7507 domain-containing protein n=1 Tax=Paenibacillus sp. RUD330 TaxID=2023772 RepID=UPI0013B47E7B|nr:beta-propeller fold lactonase family protein [Paenibacillus sp. RUD330]ASS68388.2 DUF11 domain-containing protein [Paenibacillus sp. RUD330]
MSVYVANSGSNTVSVIDQTTNTVFATIPGFSTPQQLDATPDGTRVYVANLANATVSIIQTSTNAVIGSIPVGGGPNGIVIDRTGTRAYVTNSTDGTMSVIDLATDTVTATVAVGINPIGVDVTPNNRYVYVANQISSTVSVISVSDNAVVATIPVDTTPIGVKASPDGAYVYVSTRAAGIVDVISTATQSVVGTLQAGIAPIGVSTDGMSVFVANEVSGNLTVVNPATNAIIATIPTNTFPQYIAVDSSSRFLYVSTRTNVVSVIDRTTNRLVASVPVGDQSIGIVVVPKFNLDPALAATKTVNGAEAIEARPGETVFFQLRVANTGNTLLSGIQLTDALEPAGALLLNETLTTLAPGESVTREIPYVVPDPAPASVLTNRFIADAPLSGISSESDAVINVGASSPLLALTKTADRAAAAPGEIVTYTIVVTNTGSMDLSNLVLSDATLGLNQIIGSLMVGESATITASFAIPAGTPAGTALINTAFVEGGGAAAEDSASVTVSSAPALSLLKEADPATAVPGESIRYTFTVTNTGNEPLTGIVISDPRIGASIFIDGLAVGASATRSLDFAVPEGTPPGLLVNTAEAAADQGASANASATVMIAPVARIVLNKNASPTTAFPGETVAYTIEIVNTGTATLTNVRVTDPFLGLDQVVDSLVPGARATFTGTFTLPVDALAGTEFTNVASVVTDQTPSISQEAVVTVRESPSIFLEKSVSPANASVGETVIYTFVIRNTGNVLLTDPLLLDPSLGLNRGLPAIPPGGSVTETVAFVVPPDAPDLILNTASAQASSMERFLVSQSDSSLFVIRLTKTATQAEASPGERISYTFIVENTGNVPLTNLVLSDPELGVSERIPFLDAGNALTFSLNYVILPMPGGTVIVNTATVGGDGVSAESSASVTVRSIPGMSILKTASAVSAAPGEVITFMIQTVNTGNVTLPDVTVTDPLLGIATAPAPLDPGGTLTLTGTYSVPAGTPAGTIITNTATASSALTGVREGAASVIVAAAPALSIAKTVDRETASPGQSVLFTIIVTNVSAATLAAVRITDPVLSIDETVASLAPGAQAVLTSSFLIPAGTPAGTVITNTAQALAPLTVPVSASASVVVAAVPSLTVIKEAGVSEAPAGTLVFYEVSILNTGNIRLTNLLLTDSFVSATLAIAFLEPGESQSQLVPFRLPAGLAPGDLFTNTVTVSSTETGPVQDSAQVLILPPPDVELTASPYPAYVLPGQRVTVTITATNRADTTLTNLAVFNGFTGIDDRIASLAPGESIALAREVFIPPLTRAGTEFPSLAYLETDQTTTRTAPVLVIVLPDPSFRLTKTASTAEAIAGETVRFRVEAVNTGNTDLNGVLADPLLSVAIGPGTLLYQSRIILTMPYTIPPETENGAVVTNTVRSQGVLKELQASASVKVLRVLEVTKSADVLETFLGAVIRYTVVVENNSGFTAEDAILTDDLSPSLALVPDSVTIGGRPAPAASLKNGIPLGTIAPGRRLVIAFAARVLSIPRPAGAGSMSSDHSGVLLNQAVVTFGVRSPSGRDVVVRALSNISRISVTEEEE